MFSAQALKKKQLISAGKLDKHGRPNENTPQEWIEGHPDLRCALWLLLRILTEYACLFCVMAETLRTENV